MNSCPAFRFFQGYDKNGVFSVCSARSIRFGGWGHPQNFSESLSQIWMTGKSQFSFVLAAPPQKTEYKPYKSWADVAEKHWEGPPQHFDPAGVVERPASSQASQDIVPQQLIDHFVSMTHPSQAQKTDNEIAHHCAFSLPAVALTLGQDNWILLKDAYNALASDMQVIIYNLLEAELTSYGRWAVG